MHLQIDHADSDDQFGDMEEVEEGEAAIDEEWARQQTL